MCMERLLFAIKFCPTSDITKAINSIVVAWWQKVTRLNKVFIAATIEKSSWLGTEPSYKAPFIFSKPYSSLIFSRASSSIPFLFTNFSFKISSASGPNIFAKPSPSSSFGRSSRSSKILSSSSFCTLSFYLSLFSCQCLCLRTI